MRQEEKTRREKTDFGVYHHTSPAASVEIRGIMQVMFTDAFVSLPFTRDAKVKILDVGCGLGFLSCVSAEFYKNARVTGIDMFKHASLKDSSPKKAKENAKILDVADRIDFRKCDMLKFSPTGTFDLIVSNLVFHNLGKRRFDAYQRLARWTKFYAILGDLFFDYEIDLRFLSNLFANVKDRSSSTIGQQYRILQMSKN